MRGNYKSFINGTNLTVVEGMHQFIMYSVRGQTAILPTTATPAVALAALG